MLLAADGGGRRGGAAVLPAAAGAAQGGQGPGAAAAGAGAGPGQLDWVPPAVPGLAAGPRLAEVGVGRGCRPRCASAASPAGPELRRGLVGAAVSRLFGCGWAVLPAGYSLGEPGTALGQHQSSPERGGHGGAEFLPASLKRGPAKPRGLTFTVPRSGGYGGIRPEVGLDDVCGLFQPTLIV